MEQKLKTLYDALLTIETKGTSTLTMANCINYLNNLMNETRAEANRPVHPVEPPVEHVEGEIV